MTWLDSQQTTLKTSLSQSPTRSYQLLNNFHLYSLQLASGKKKHLLNEYVVSRWMKNSLSHEALGHVAELPAAVLDQVTALAHHHVVELLALLRDHHVRIPLHAQLQTCSGNITSVKLNPFHTLQICDLYT